MTTVVECACKSPGKYRSNMDVESLTLLRFANDIVLISKNLGENKQLLEVLDWTTNKGSLSIQNLKETLFLKMIIDYCITILRLSKRKLVLNKTIRKNQSSGYCRKDRTNNMGMGGACRKANTWKMGQENIGLANKPNTTR